MANKLKSNTRSQADVANGVFTIVDNGAEPVGGFDEYLKYIKANLKYPQTDVEGKVYVQFIVEKDGSLNELKVVKGIEGGCDKEAMRVIAASPKWTPGSHEGNPIRQRIVIPIAFSLGK
jgi:periplasmic protein TonB